MLNRTILAAMSFIFLLSACGSSYMFRRPYPEEYWGQSGFSSAQVKKSLQECGGNYPEQAVCMLRKGFNYLDPDQACDSVDDRSEIRCMSRKNLDVKNHDWICAYEKGYILCQPI